MLLVASLLALAAGPLPADPLALRAHGLLSRHCARCHAGGVSKGGLGVVLDRGRLVEQGLIQPGDAATSPLFQRVAKGEMPPGKSTWGREDTALLRRWIAAGAPAVADRRGEPIPFAQVRERIRADLAKLPPRDARFARYLSLGHLGAQPPDELRTLRHAMAKLVNSLSWHARLSAPVAIDDARLVYRLDLRHYRWTARLWEKLVAASPYRTSSDDVVLRADWFVATASRPPFYFDFLQLPLTDRALERVLQVNTPAGLEDGTAARAGFNNSGVARSNRVLERHDAPFGAFWRSHDFSDNTGRQNIFEAPTTFRAAGGEIIFHLPNGLQGYLIVDGDGRRIDRAPGEVVQDPNRPDRLVETGLSCMGCHAQGIIPKDDQVRSHVRANRKAFAADVRDAVKTLYVPAERFRKLVAEDNERFARALSRLRVPASGPEPIITAVLAYERVVPRAQVAAELDLSPAELARLTDRDAELARALGATTVQRQVIEQTYARLERTGPVLATVPREALRGHRGAVEALAWAPDGSAFVSAGADRDVRLWDWPGGKSRVLVRHPDDVLAVAINGRLVASAGADRDILLHDRAGRLVQRLRGHTAAVRALVFLPDGIRLVSAGNDRAVRVWDVVRGVELLAVGGHTGNITSLAISGDGKLVVTGSTDRSVRVWNVTEGTERSRRTAGAEVHAVAVANDGRIAAGTSGGHVIVWDGEGVAKELRGPTGTVRAVLIDGETVLASGSRDRALWRWAGGKAWRGDGLGPVGAAALRAGGPALLGTEEGVRAAPLP